MQLALIGVGRVGGLVVDALVAHNRADGGRLVTGALAVDTAVADVESLRHVPAANRVAVGAAYPCRAGVEGDNELGASIAAEDLDAILAGVDCLPSHRADAFLVVAALGGGTGGGGAPVVARALRRLFLQPVYGLGVLPARDADELTAYNAARSLVTFVREVDNLVVDTGSSAYGSDVSTLARRVATVFGTDAPTSKPLSAWGTDVDTDALGGGDVEAADGAELFDATGTPTHDDGPDSTAMAVFQPDRTAAVPSVLAAGRLSVLSGSRLPVKRRLLGRLQGNRATGAETMTVVRGVRDAAFGVAPRRHDRWSVQQGPDDDATLHARPPDAEAAWLALDGPPGALSRHGIEYAQQWLREEVGAGLVGGRSDHVAGDTLTSTLLLSGVHHVPRLDDLLATAVERQSQRAGDGRSRELSRSSPPTLDTVTGTVEPLF